MTEQNKNKPFKFPDTSIFKELGRILNARTNISEQLHLLMNAKSDAEHLMLLKDKEIQRLKNELEEYKRIKAQTPEKISTALESSCF